MITWFNFRLLIWYIYSWICSCTISHRDGCGNSDFAKWRTATVLARNHGCNYNRKAIVLTHDSLTLRLYYEDITMH